MKTFRLDGKTALVTGSSRGIGRAIAQTFAEAGADVALLARDAEQLAEVAAIVESFGQRVIVLPCDVMDPAAIDQAVATAISSLGHLDVVVNNAGGNSFSRPVVGMRFSGWERTFALNLDSAVHVLQAALPHMLQRGSGSIINVSSLTALRGAPLMAHYAASKAALVSLTQSLAIETAAAGLRVNALLPGWVETDLTAFLRDDDSIGAPLIARVPMARWGGVEEIAAPALFLASDASSFMTGQTLVVDGGLSANP
ncbi:MAG: SDR family NAD(P)-dependent oxidoreductase [Actinomycetes bacterium]|jgi:2-deoxy-D-gluconate 3-dehydrogenase